MGTNYHTVDDNHVGKLTSNGLGRGQTFFFAMDREDVLDFCVVHFEKRVIIDGDKAFTGREFLHILTSEDMLHDLSQVGMEFS